MAKIQLINQKGEKLKDLTLADDIWNIETNDIVLKKAIDLQLAATRQGTAKTKTRSEVSGGGRKPWRQKGTGRARAGSSRSPIWVGGGTVFGPDGRQNYKLSMNKKSHSLALKSALSIKASEKNIVVVKELNAAKTKEFIQVLENLKIEGKALVVLAEDNDELYRSARNIPGIKVVLANNVCVYDLLNTNKLLCTVDSIKAIEGGLK